VTGTQVALVRRELWEHRSIYVTPLVIGFLVSLMAVTGQATVSANDHVLNLALFGISSLGPQERAALIAATAIGVAMLLALAMVILLVFYGLDALYAERRDRSILFWRSMPVTDAETVVSKLVTALIAIPLVTFAVTVATQLVVLSSASVWLAARGADVANVIWTVAPLGQVGLVTLAYFVALPLWLSPYVGWFLLVSAFARRAPLLVAFLPMLVLPMLEKTLVGTSVLTNAFLRRPFEMPLFSGFDFRALIFGGGRAELDLLARLDLGGFLASPGLWAGLVACAVFSAGAVWLRRYRDDS